MTTIKCRSCGQPIEYTPSFRKSQTLACQACQQPMPVTAAWIPLVVFGSFAGVLVAGCSGLVSMFPKSVSGTSAVATAAPKKIEPPKENPDIHGAWAHVQLAVEQQLVSPATADFPFGGSRHVTPLGNDRYGVNSYVDSQNRFGATIRTKFHCVIRKNGTRWTAEKLTLSE